MENMEKSPQKRRNLSLLWQFLKGAKRYFLQNFIDSGDIVSPGNTPVAPQVMAEMVKTAQYLVGSASAR